MNSKFKIVNLLFATLLFTLTISITACVKNEFDSPPTETKDPDIAADQIVSLEEVLAKWQTGKYTKIDIDKYVKGIVVSDDGGGNFYKSLVVEDESSDYGIMLLIDEVEMHNIYPVGRRVFIHVKDLWISDYNGLPQIGYGPENSNGQTSMGRIPAALMRKIVVPGKAGNEVAPFEANINELGELRLNTLVKLNNVEFSYLDDTYATVGGTSSSNRTIVNCNGDEIILRTSDFVDWAGEKVAQGKGSIVGVYSIYRDDKQFTVRSLSDIDMKGPRCGAPAGGEERINIIDLRNVFKGSATVGPKAYIQGVVISDIDNENLSSQNVVIQDGTAGMLVRFKNDHNFKLGQEIKVVCTDVELSEYRGWLQLNNVNLAFASLVGNGTLPTPKEVTIQEIRSNHDAYESTLVKLKKVTVTNANGTYSGNATITDAANQNMILRTESYASFANTGLKTGEVDLVGIVSEYSPSVFTPQLNLRNLDDVIGGTSTGGNDDTKHSIKDIRDTYKGTKTTAPSGYIQGIVISDYVNKNIQSRNVVIQSEGYGIMVRFTADHAFGLGAELKIKVSGVELSEFNETLQLNNVPNTNVTVIGTGNTVVPKEITIANLKSDFERYESTLVKIKDATFSGGSKFSEAIKINDATGQIDHFTRPGTTGATFVNTAVPTGSKNITAVVTQYNTNNIATEGYQLSIRNLNDIQ